jgi:hypothetical protein
MSRYALICDFEDMMISHGHPKPFRSLFEVKSLIQTGRQDATRSVFGTTRAVETCWSFNADCEGLDPPSDYDFLGEIRQIEQIDSGEALLIERAVHMSDALIITGDRRMIRGLCDPGADVIRNRIKGRVLFIERAIWSLREALGITEIRSRIHRDPDCDDAIYNAMHPDHTERKAAELFFGRMRDFENTSRGLLRRSSS